MYSSPFAEPRRLIHIRSALIPVIELQIGGTDRGVTEHSTRVLARELSPACTAGQRTDNHGPAIAACQTPTIRFPAARY